MAERVTAASPQTGEGGAKVKVDGSDAAASGAEAVAASRRLVIKVGSALVCAADGAPNGRWLATLGADIARLRAEGRHVIVVTSGAIALGRRRLGLSGRLRLEEKQAASAVGQTLLIEAWREALAPAGICVAQLLLTLSDVEDRRRYLNARATLETLLELEALPVINENDTVATAEIRYGDNDRLAAHAAQIAGADLLVILSDIDGLYTADPRADPDARHIARVVEIDASVEAMARGANAAAGVGSGGMATKIAAAKIAGAAGCAAIIAPGAVDHPLAAIREGGRATLFVAGASPESARRLWIGGRLKATGSVQIDAGARAALLRGASLLPAGVVAVEGAFSRGDAVRIVGPAGEVLGQGLAAFDAADVRRIMGRQSADIDAILGYRRRPAVIERHDLTLLTQLPET